MAAFQFSYPDIPVPNGGTPAYQTHTLDATGDRVGIVFRAEEPMTVTSVQFRQGTITGDPDDLRVGLQEVDTATGIYNGTWLGGVSNYATYGPIAGNNNAFVTATLPTAVTLTRGQVVAIVLQPVAGGGSGWDGSDFMTISRTMANVAYGHRGPYAIDNGTKSTNQNPVYIVNTSTRSYGFPVESITSRSNNTGSTPDEWGMYFRVPSGVCSTYKIQGVRIAGVASAGDWRLRLYDTNGTTVLQEVLVDKDEVSMGTAYPSQIYWEDSTLATLNAGSYYRIAFAPTTTTSTGAIYAWELDSANNRICFFGDAADVSATERTDGGAWTETNTRIWAMQALIIDVTAPTGGGGLAANPLAGYVR
jgi:hypothetical protein